MVGGKWQVHMHLNERRRFLWHRYMCVHGSWLFSTAAVAKIFICISLHVVRWYVPHVQVKSTPQREGGRKWIE